MSERLDDLIFDWNKADMYAPKPQRRVMFDDETLRDGLQSPAVTNPSIAKKIELLHLMDRLGIDTANRGLPGAGPFPLSHTRALAQNAGKRAKRDRRGQAHHAREHIDHIDPVAGAGPDQDNKDHRKDQRAHVDRREMSRLADDHPDAEIGRAHV